MHSRIFVLLITLFVVACNNEQEKPAEPAKADSVDRKETGKPVDAAHNAQNSLDWAGTYKGTVPCADCEGIETTLTLNSDNTYEYRASYLGKSADRGIEAKGNFEWKAGKNIVLHSDKTIAVWFAVEENKLVQLSEGGARIGGEIGEKFILDKIK